MHVFFEPHWKLHIGEIPEKPKLSDFPYNNRSNFFKWAIQSYNAAIATIKQNALTVGNPKIITTDEVPGEPGEPYKPGEFYFWPGGYETKEKDIYVEAGGNYIHTETITVAILTLPEEKKNTMENMTKEQANLVRLINEGLSVIRQKKMEYLACSADGNPNWEYFKGKADAYEYAYKTFKRILEWTASGSVATPKEEELQAEIMAFELVKSKDLIDECYHYLKANPPSKLTATYSKWESLVEETDYLRKYNADAEYERINREDYQDELFSIRQQLKEREEELQALKDGIREGSELYANLKFDDEPTGYQIALKKIQEREEALNEFAQVLLDYKRSGVEVNIDYLLDKFPYENIKGKI